MIGVACMGKSALEWLSWQVEWVLDDAFHIDVAVNVCKLVHHITNAGISCEHDLHCMVQSEHNKVDQGPYLGLPLKTLLPRADRTLHAGRQKGHVDDVGVEISVTHANVQVQATASYLLYKRYLEAGRRFCKMQLVVVCCKAVKRAALPNTKWGSKLCTWLPAVRVVQGFVSQQPDPPASGRQRLR